MSRTTLIMQLGLAIDLAPSRPARQAARQALIDALHAASGDERPALERALHGCGRRVPLARCGVRIGGAWRVPGCTCANCAARMN